MTVSTKKHILFLCPAFDIIAPRNIRAENIALHLSEEYRISILYFKSLSPRSLALVENSSIRLLPLNYSFVSKYISNKTFSGYTPKGLVKFISKALNFMLLKAYIFPDPWVLELGKLLAYMDKADDKADVLVASIMPFSMAKLASQLKEKYSIKTILDIGDPLAYNAASNKSISQRKIDFESKYLNSADHIIVTNEATRAHYLKAYNLQEQECSVIAQGVSNKMLVTANKELNSDPFSQLVYAGTFYKELRDPSAFFSALDESETKLKLEVYGKFPKHFELPSKRISYHGSIAQAALAEKYNEAHALLFFDNRHGMQTSGKIFELIALKKPIVFLYYDGKSILKNQLAHYKHILFVKNDHIEIEKRMPEIEEFIKAKYDFEYDISEFLWEAKAKAFSKVIDSIV